jgi:hypothetical protein
MGDWHQDRLAVGRYITLNIIYILQVTELNNKQPVDDL